MWLRLETASQDHLSRSLLALLFLWFYLISSYIMEEDSTIMRSLSSSAPTLNEDVMQESHANPNLVCDSFFPQLCNEDILCWHNKWMTAQFYKDFPVIYSFINTISLQRKSFYSVLKYFSWQIEWNVKESNAYILSWLSLLCVHPPRMIIAALLIQRWNAVLTNIQDNLLCAVRDPYTKLVYYEGKTHTFWQTEIWNS